MEIDGLIDDEEDFQPRSVRPRTTRSLQIAADSESDDASVDNAPNPNTDTDDASDSDGQPGKRKRKKSAKGIQKKQNPKNQNLKSSTQAPRGSLARKPSKKGLKHPFSERVQNKR